MENTHSLGHFLEYSDWENALRLLNFQIEQKKKNRSFNTLGMSCYEQLDANVSTLGFQEYFEQRVANNLFYGLAEEFNAFWYTVPKSHLTLRRWVYMTYPLRTTYYAIGLYLLKLSQEFLAEQRKDQPHIEAFYGGRLFLESDMLRLKPEHIYFLPHYKTFRKKIKKEAVIDSADKLVILLDVANYFNELPIDNLLTLLESNIKPSCKTRLKYDADTVEQLRFFMKFVVQRNVGIPLADNDIVSAFIGHLYLSFADLSIADIVNCDPLIVKKHAIVRYMDDIYISITFHETIDKQSRVNYANTITSTISDALHYNFDLRLNSKSKFYWLDDPNKKNELIRNLKKVSSGYIIPDDEEDDDPQIKVEQIFTELEKLKVMEPRCIYEHDFGNDEDILKEVFDKRVGQILEKENNKVRLESIFCDFNFELVKLCPLELLILVLKSPKSSESLKALLISKSNLTTYDTDLIIRFLCQIGFKDDLLVNKLKSGTHLQNVIEAYMNPRLSSDRPGYFNLDWSKCLSLASCPYVIDQIRLRRSAEISGTFSVALNHLQNEIHAICWKVEAPQNLVLKNYDVTHIMALLISKRVPSTTCTKIRNLFDRRNNNLISHPSAEYGGTGGVTKIEYEDYRQFVGHCLGYLL